MPYDSSGPGSYIPVDRVEPITNDFVGDLTKGGNYNTQGYMDLRRPLKAPVRVATTANHGLTGLTAIDGVTPVAGDRVLAKNQTAASANGIYVAAAGAWARATDFDISAEANFGSIVPVISGTVGAGTFWALTTTGAITLGTTSLTFTQIGADANTLNGVAEAVAATASTIVKRGTDSTILAANHASLGAAGAAGTAIVADAQGKVPTVALPNPTDKAPVRVATTANHALSGLTAIDGVTPVAGNRVLVKNQTTASQNGVYTAAAGAWARAADADVSAEVLAGTLIVVTEGTTQADTAWLLTTNDPIVLGTTALTFARFASDALTLNGASADVNATADTVAKRGADGTLKVVQHASAGAAGAAGTIPVLNGQGMLDAAIVPIGDLALEIAVLGW